MEGKNLYKASVGLFLLLGILFSTISHAQTSQDLEISSPLAEEVFVHLSHKVLLTGDELWMHITVRNDDKPSPSKVAYMEMLDREGNPVKQAMVELVQGKAVGYLEMPEKINSDNYLLRVYTRNSPHASLSAGIYHQILTLINPQSPPTSIVSKQEDTLEEQSNRNNNGYIRPNKNIYGTKEKAAVSIKTHPSKPYHLSITQLSPLPSYGHLPPADEIYELSNEKTVFIPEIYGHIIQGKSLANRIDTTETFYLSAHGRQSNLFLTKPLANGDLFFETGAFKHFDYVIVQSAKSEDQVNFILESPFLNLRPKPEFQLPKLALSENEREFILDQLLARETKKHFYPSLPIALSDNPPFLNADRTYLLDDYNRFEDIATTFREYVPEILVRRRDRKIHFRNLNVLYGNTFQNDPLLLIDAMPVFDSDALSRLNPKGIKKLEVVNRHYFFQEDIFEGIIHLTSFKNDFGEFDLPRNALFIEYPGMQFPKSIPALIPDERNRTPDFRNMLLWESGAKTNELGEQNVEFLTSELQGLFEIRLSYFDEKDEWSEHTQVIEVR